MGRHIILTGDGESQYAEPSGVTMLECGLIVHWNRFEFYDVHRDDPDVDYVGPYGFPIWKKLVDVKLTGIGDARAMPPYGHPRRCRGAKKRSLREAGLAGDPLIFPHVRQCNRRSELQSEYCSYHGRRQNGRAAARGKALKNMGERYLRNAGTVLKELLTRYGKEAPHERHALDDEIDATRMICERAITAYDRVVLDPSSTASEELKAMATASLQANLARVGELVTKSAKTRALAKDLVEVQTLDWVIAQITSAIDTVVRSERPDLADALVAELKEIRLPDRGEKHGPGNERDQLELTRRIEALDDSVPEA